MKVHTYDPKKAVAKGATEAGSAGGLAILLGIIMRAIRVKNPDLPWSPTETSSSSARASAFSPASCVGSGTGANITASERPARWPS